MPIRSALAVVAAAMAAVLSAPAAAQPPAPPAAAPVLDPLFACQAEAEVAARVACYDREVTRLRASVQSGEASVVDRASIRQARRSLFGFSVPSFDLFGGGPRTEADRVDSITSTLVSRSEGRDGRTTFHLEDGSAWRQVGSDYVRARRGDTVRVERGSLGSYFIHIGNQGGVRAQRVQ